MAETITKLEVNDILYASWGYEQTNIDFYKVKRLVGKTMVELVKVANKMADNQDCEYSINVIPYPASEGKEIFRRKIKGKQNPYVRISTYKFAELWDGIPKAETHPYYGH